MDKKRLDEINLLIRKIDTLKENINRIETIKANTELKNLDIKLHVKDAVNPTMLFDDCFYKDEFIELYLLKAYNLLAKLRKEFESI